MEIFTLILALLFGCGCGIITGLIPGVHVNTIAILVLASLPFLSQYFSPLALAIILMSMCIVHSFLDFIPSVFMGAPDETTALSVLPGHQLLMKGEGYRAVKLSVIGGLGSFLICIAILPVLFFTLKPIEPILKMIIPFILIILSAVFILKERGMKGRIWAFLIFMLSGILGLVSLSHINVKTPLFPLLAGLFGVSTLIISLFGESHVTKQKLEADVKLGGKSNFLNYLKAAGSSLIVSVLPAVGAAQAAGIAQGFVKFKNQEDFIVIVGGINTAGVIFTLGALYLMGKARSGVIVAMQQFLTLDGRAFAILIAAAFIAVGVAVILSMYIAKWFAKHISSVNYHILSFVIIGVIGVLVGLLSGLLGLLILSVAVGVGLLAPLAGVRRIHAMGVLVIPILMYFL